MDNLEILSLRLRELRSKTTLKQGDFAKSIDIRQATYSAYEKGTNKPPIDILIKISQRYNVSIDWLCGLTNDRKEPLQLNTCSDILRTIFQLGALDGTNIGSGFGQIDYGSPNGGCDSKHSSFEMLYFNDTTINDILAQWQRMSDLLNDGTIDRELYDLWIEKILKQNETPYHADKKILKQDDKKILKQDDKKNDSFWDSIPDEEELPFA